MLSERSTLAFYREGVFQAQLSDLDVDYLARDPRDIQLRWMRLGSRIQGSSLIHGVGGTRPR